jgi:hypothetical protein
MANLKLISEFYATKCTEYVVTVECQLKVAAENLLLDDI